MRPKSSELFDQIKNSSYGILASVVVEEQKRVDQDETVLELLKEQHLDSKIDCLSLRALLT